MKKVLALLFPLLLWGETRWLSYDEAIAKALAEHKRVMVMAESEHCPYCHVMTDEVLIAPEVARRLEAHFVLVRMDKNDRRLPTRATMTPTFFFVDPATQNVYKKIPGAWGAKDFCDLLDAAIKEPL